MSMRNILIAGAVFGALATASSGASAANLILNGGFNNGGTVGAPGGGFSTLGVGSSVINNWNIDAGSIDWIVGYWQAADGDGYSIDLNGGSPAQISQTLSTVAGQSYFLSFAMSGNPDNFRGETRVAVIGAGGSTIGTANYSLTAPNSLSNMLWQDRGFAFTADSSSTLISFTSGNNTGNCCWGAAIDNVAVNAVPEPATWAMMIVGFGAAGSMIRRRSNAFAG
ncbi:choice-of-anchor C family protein [uncultured Phenylobacterium sp.]|uniref:choice-of-anchor C family PEP-CTERM protein n=1 Tax=uncultured Phenylobacterium sp. TaxID=349273 RepID=UPI0025E43AAD|nr:choice-of-anchor C family protein [uncultured Phenylobacterium sp.]